MGAMMPKTDFNQLSRISFLIEHYQIHKQEAELKSEDFGVWDFIYLHYISPDDHVHDFPVDHNELPFKNITISVLFANVESVIDVVEERVLGFKKNYAHTGLSDRLVNQFLLRPPKLY